MARAATAARPVAAPGSVTEDQLEALMARLSNQPARGGIRGRIEGNFRESKAADRVRLDIVFDEDAPEAHEEPGGSPVQGIPIKDQFQPDADVFQLPGRE